jgi:hypothetical protein
VIKVGDSAEEMLNVTMKRIESIMDSFPAKQALEAETHNLIDAAITVLKTYKKDLTTDKVAESWGKLQDWARILFIESLIIRGDVPAVGQFHLSGRLMAIICLCKMEQEQIRLGG